MTQLTGAQRIETIEPVDPRGDSANIQETAHRLVEGLRRGVGDREARVRETAELASRVEARFDAYDSALAAARRAKEAAEDRSREMEARVVAVRADAEQAIAEIGRRHHAEAEAVAEAHRMEALAAEEEHRQEISRLREGLDRLKEEMGRRFMRIEEENAELQAELARQTDENVSLNQSIQMLIVAVEASARSLQAEDSALGVAMASVRDRAAEPDLPPGVVRLPQRQARPEGDASLPVPQSRTAGAV